MLDSRSLHRAMMDDHLCPGIRPLHTRHTTDRITSWLWDREGCPFERAKPVPLDAGEHSVQCFSLARRALTPTPPAEPEERGREIGNARSKKVRWHR